MDKTVEEKSIYKKLPRSVLVLIPTILLILLLGAMMGAIAGFKSMPEMLENGAVKLEVINDGATQMTELKKNEQAMVDANSNKDAPEGKRSTIRRQVRRILFSIPHSSRILLLNR